MFTFLFSFLACLLKRTAGNDVYLSGGPVKIHLIDQLGHAILRRWRQFFAYLLTFSGHHIL